MLHKCICSKRNLLNIIDNSIECYILLQFVNINVYQALIINNIQPMIKNNPPIGVIIPRVLKPDIASMYKLPEKIMIPIKNAQPLK